mgnify:CR=1 FL=1
MNLTKSSDYKYQEIGAFADAGNRAIRVKKRIAKTKKKKSDWFKFKRQQMQKEEREVFVASKRGDEEMLKDIAVGVAMFCLSVGS